MQKYYFFSFPAHIFPKIITFACRNTTMNMIKAKDNTQIIRLWLLTALLVICGTGSFASCSSNDETSTTPTIERIKQRGTILIGTTGDYRPLSFREADGTYWGFEPYHDTHESEFLKYTLRWNEADRDDARSNVEKLLHALRKSAEEGFIPSSLEKYLFPYSGQNECRVLLPGRPQPGRSHPPVPSGRLPSQPCVP